MWCHTLRHHVGLRGSFLVQTVYRSPSSHACLAPGKAQQEMLIRSPTRDPILETDTQKMNLMHSEPTELLNASILDHERGIGYGFMEQPSPFSLHCLVPCYVLPHTCDTCIFGIARVHICSASPPAVDTTYRGHRHRHHVRHHCFVSFRCWPLWFREDLASSQLWVPQLSLLLL